MKHDKQQNGEPTDYEANSLQREQNFTARAAAAVTGSIAAVMTGKRLVQRALRSYLQKGLFARDWRDGSVEDVIKGVARGDYDTISGAITDPMKLAHIHDHGTANMLRGNGTLVGDKVMNRALRHLYASHLTEDPSNPGEMIFKDGFLKKGVDTFNEKVGALKTTHASAVEALEKKYFAKDPQECRDAVKDVSQFLDGTIDTALRDDRVKEFEKKAFFKSGTNIHKFLEEAQKLESNFIRTTNSLKMKLIDTPVYDEMIKAGTQPGRMGLKLRHAHNRGEVIAFSAGAGVAVGYIAYKAAKSYVHRNDTIQENPNFQAGVKAGREQAQHEHSAVRS